MTRTSPIATWAAPQPTGPGGDARFALANVLIMFHIAAMQEDEPTIPENLRRPGRAALSNRSGRHEAHARVVADDGWDMAEDPQLARTTVTLERPRRVITRNSSPDIPFDRSLNPYRGCEHGCIYCFARPTHAWLGYSAGLDFETRLIARPEAALALRRELSAPRYAPAPLAIGTATDPYQPVEKYFRIMRQVLETLREFRHPVMVTTKGTLVERDADILGEMGHAGLARVAISLTTLDADLARRMEPRAPAPARRLGMIERLAASGCPVSVMVAPVVPGLTDHEIEAMLEAAAAAGASSAAWILLRLPGEVRGLFCEWLAARYPHRAGRVLARLRDAHGGREYRAGWGSRMRGQGVHAQLIEQRFRLAARRLGLDAPPPPLRLDLFRVPGRARQLTLL